MTEIKVRVPAEVFAIAGTARLEVAGVYDDTATTDFAITAAEAVTAGSLTQGDGVVTVDVTWAGSPVNPSIDCGTVPSQSVDGASGTCTYRTAGMYTIQGSYVTGGSRVDAAPITITVPSIAPAAAALRITSLDGQANPVHDTSGATPVVTMGTPTVFPIPMSLQAALVLPDGSTGVLEPLSTAAISSQPVSSTGGALAAPSSIPVSSQPTPISTLSNVGVGNIVEDFSDPTTWRVKFTITGTTSQGTQVAGDLILQGPRGNGSTVTATSQKSAPIYPYPPAVYKWTLTGAQTPTTNEPLQNTWTVRNQNNNVLPASISGNTLTILFTNPGTNSITLNIDGLFAGTKTVLADTVTVPTPPTPGAISFTVTTPAQNRPPAAYTFKPVYPTLGPGERITSSSPTWTVDSAPVVAGSSLTTTFNSAGDHTITVTATTSLPRQITGSKTVTVNANLPPTGTIDCSASYKNPGTPVTYTLSCKAVNAKDPDGTLKSMVWGVSELSYSKAGSTYFSYGVSTSQIFTVTLALTDNSGATTVLTTTVDTRILH